MGEERVHGLLGAVHQVQDAGRNPRFLRQLEDAGRGKRDLLARLENERIPGGDRVGPEPAGDHRGEVERRDRGEDAERLADVFAVDAAGDVFERLAHHQGGNPAGVLDVFDPAPHGPTCLIERLAVLARDRGRDLVEVLFHQILELEEIPGPDDRWHFPPFEKRGTVPSCSPVAGLVRARYSAAAGVTHSPPT